MKILFFILLLSSLTFSDVCPYDTIEFIDKMSPYIISSLVSIGAYEISYNLGVDKRNAIIISIMSGLLTGSFLILRF